MNQFRIARIMGVDVLGDPSWILIFALMVWNIATALGHMHGESGVPIAHALGLSGAVGRRGGPVAAFVGRFVFGASRSGRPNALILAR